MSDFLFNKICIIGVGLIGGSLGLSLRKNHVARHIVGLARSQETIDRAIELGIIDEGSITPLTAVENADIIVLCSPLGTYKKIIDLIEVHLKEGAIITDAGSVKQLPTEEVLGALQQERREFFIPAHPIAGTEKSGPEAAFDSLYEGKLCIITPTPIANQDALLKVRKMWEEVGSKVVEMPLRKHDMIYAAVSHNIQLLSSAFGLAFLKCDWPIRGEIINKPDSHFKQFIRLAGSDAVMWRDIFIENRQNINLSLERFLVNINSLREQISSGEEDVLEERLQSAHEKRMLLRNMHRANVKRDDEVNYSSFGAKSLPWVSLLPRLISCAVMEGISDGEYDFADGAGLHGFTRNILLNDALQKEDIFANKVKLLTAIDSFIGEVLELRSAMVGGDASALEDLLSQARECYLQINACG